MKFSHFFIDRPIFAAVVSILITLVGIVAYYRLAVTEFPDVIPPTVTVTANYPGATPDIVSKTVATPLEQEINGVEHMIYMESQCSADGSMRITVTFELGTNIDFAQILVQNRVSIAEVRLPSDVRALGVQVKKRSPDFLLMIQLYSPDNSRDKLYLTNYALTQIKDRLARIYGVSEIEIHGQREYSMRVWIDPEKLDHLDMSSAEVVNAVNQQSRQVAAGKLNAPPVKHVAPYELLINTQGRLETPEQFEDIIVKSSADGRIVRLKDVARVELGAYTYNDESYFNGKESINIALYQLPGSNALDTAKRVYDEFDKIKADFPPGIASAIGWDNTTFITQSIDAVYHTIFEAIILVVFVVMLFLQSWRAAIIPLFAIPVSLVGTFAAMYLFGFSINNLSLFGLVLAIGIVVDDAIVVVENVERNQRDGLLPREATHKAMTQVQGALIAIVLVLSSVFIPTAFIEGISGQFYRQFALTIAISTILSGLVSLTLTPALCALFLRPLDAKPDWFTRVWNFLFGWFFKGFNVCFYWISEKYGHLVARGTRAAAFVLLLYVALLGMTVWTFKVTPKGFIPKQDSGYYIVTLQLPDAISMQYTDEIVYGAQSMINKLPGVKDSVAIVGVSVASSSKASNAGTIFVTLEDHAKRMKNGETLAKLLDQTNGMLYKAYPEAQIFAMGPPAVNGIGMGGDFKFFVQDRVGSDVNKIQAETRKLIEKINQLPEVAMAFSTYRVSNPQLYVEVDRPRAQMLNVPIENIYSTMQYNLASYYINDFNILGRVYRVMAQADSDMRSDLDDIYNLKVPSARGGNVPLGSVATIKRIIGPERSSRYNMYSCAEVMGNLNPGYSTGQAIAAIEKLAKETLPQGMGIDWTDLAYQEKQVGNTAIIVFAMCVLFVFLLLSALYESWSLPLAVILIVPLVILFSMLGVMWRGMDNNIMTQIGFIVLIGLACKNAILIVEFAKQREEKGEELVSSVSTSAKNRLRPILMTSFAFIFGVLPLTVATGAGAELRQALGTSVFFGMLGVTIFGLLFTPMFYYVIRRIVSRNKGAPALPKENN